MRRYEPKNGNKITTIKIMEKALFAATEANVTVQGLLKKRAAGVSKTVP